MSWPVALDVLSTRRNFQNFSVVQSSNGGVYVFTGTALSVRDYCHTVTRIKKKKKWAPYGENIYWIWWEIRIDKNGQVKTTGCTVDALFLYAIMGATGMVFFFFFYSSKINRATATGGARRPINYSKASSTRRQYLTGGPENYSKRRSRPYNSV